MLTAAVSIVASTVLLPEIALRSDSNGRFALHLPPGRFTLRAHGMDGATGEVEVDGPPNTDDITIIID